MEYKHEKNIKRWVGYFDLLGTSKLIESGKSRQVFYSFDEACKSLATLNRHQTSIHHAWFSDTFIIYSDNDDIDSFSTIERVCRWFMTALIWHNIPVQGSIACDLFYADEVNSIYLGPALVEAYEWGENQDWIGMVLCPSCIAQLSKLKKAVTDYPNYVEYDIPFKSGFKTDNKSHAACVIGNWIREGDTNCNKLLSNLRKMKSQHTKKTIVNKYKQAIEFIERHQSK